MASPRLRGAALGRNRRATFTDILEFRARVLVSQTAKSGYGEVRLPCLLDTREAWSEVVGVVRRFLSALAWSQGSFIRIEATSGGGFPIQIGRAEGGDPTVLGKWRADYLPDQPTKKHVAPSLFIEKRSVLSTTAFRTHSSGTPRFSIVSIRRPTSRWSSTREHRHEPNHNILWHL